MQFTLSGFFAGIGGGLYVLIYEIVTFDTVSAAQVGQRAAGGLYRRRRRLLRPDPRHHRGRAAAERRQPAHQCLAALCRRAVHRHGDVRAGRADRADLHAHADLARRAAAASCSCPTAQAFPPALLVLLGFVLLVELASFTTIGAAQGKKFKIAGHLDRHHGAAAMGRCARLLWCSARCGCAREARGFRLRWDELIEDAKRPSGVSAGGDGMTAPAVELRDVRKNFGAHRDHPRRQPRHPARRAPRHHRPQRRRQDHAVQPDQRPVPDHLGHDRGRTASRSPAWRRRRSTASACRAASRSPRSSRA